MMTHGNFHATESSVVCRQTDQNTTNESMRAAFSRVSLAKDEIGRRNTLTSPRNYRGFKESGRKESVIFNLTTHASTDIHLSLLLEL